MTFQLQKKLLLNLYKNFYLKIIFEGEIGIKYFIQRSCEEFFIKIYSSNEI